MLSCPDRKVRDIRFEFVLWVDRGRLNINKSSKSNGYFLLYRL